MRHSLPLAVVLCTAVACSQHPTAPSAAFDGVPAVGASSEDGAVALRALAGRATNALTGAGAAGVTVRIAGVADLAADANGNFALESEAPDGRYRVSVSGANVVERQTSIAFPGGTALLSLIPTTFNVRAFDQMVRQFGEPLGVTKRWTQAPALVIDTSLVDPQSVDAGGVPQYPPVASADQLSEASINELVTHFTRALPLMTGGHIQAFSSVSRSTAAAGTVLDMDATGTIIVQQFRGLDTQCSGYTFFLYDTMTLEASQARVFMKTCTDARTAAASLASIIAHELGHALGYGHVSAAPSVMTATVTSDVTEFDRQAAAIVFQRPPGNQWPDVDPDAFSVNQPAAMRGAGRTAIVGPVP